jgi:hypothetical protein
LHGLSIVTGWIGLWVVLATGCQPVPNMRGPQKMPEQYERILRSWTQSQQINHSLDRIMVVHATYLSPEFRKAFGDQYLRIFGIDPGKVDSDLEKIATSVGRGHEFFVFADTNDPSWNNLDEYDSVWRLGLWGAENQPGVPPIVIHRFRGRGPNLRAFFPYLNEFGRSYLVIFPLDQPNGQPVLDTSRGVLKVKLASAFGTATLSWEVHE